MALMFFGAFSTNTNASASSIEYEYGSDMIMQMSVEELEELANPSGEWQGNIWVEGDTLYYSERFSNKAHFWRAWILRTADCRFYWDDYFKQWTSVARINFGVVDGYEKQYPLNKSEVDCPNQFEYKEYASHPTSFAKRFGFNVKSKYLYALMEMGDVALGEKLLFKPWKKYIKDKRGKKIAYALDLILHETTTELWAGCEDVTPEPYCGDGICNNGETWQTCSTDCPEPPDQCPLVNISSANVVYLAEGFKLNGQLDPDSPWYDQLPDAQNRVYLDCDYAGEVLEFSTCYETEPGCAAPCPDSPWYYEQYPGNPGSYHYQYFCR